MAAVWMEAGTDATQDLSFFSSTSGTVASASDQAHTGLRSLKLSTGSPAADAQAQAPVLNDAGRRISLWVRFGAAPSSSSVAFVLCLAADGNGIHQLRLSASRKVVQLIYDSGSTFPQVTGTAVLELNTWHRITLSYIVTSTTNFTFKCYVNGVLDSTMAYTTNALARTGTNKLVCYAQSTIGANVDTWFDDIYVDDGSDCSDTGDVRVTAKRPNANSTNTFDTTTSTTNSGYGTGNSIYVNQRPLSTTGARRHNGTGTATENYAIENAATGDVDLTNRALVARLSWMHASGVSTDTLFDNNGSATPASGNVGSAGIYYKVSTSTTYPSNPATGMGRPTGNATDAILNECGVMIAYTAFNPAWASSCNTLIGEGVK